MNNKFNELICYNRYCVTHFDTENNGLTKLEIIELNVLENIADSELFYVDNNRI